MREIIVALAGNPNSGKTTVFNALTGARQHVGNYPGVTVEKKEGAVERNGVRFHFVDLPGTYSLSAQSPEEVVARNYLVDDKPGVVVQVLDAANLERNLFLATQLMELGVKLVFALNMQDVVEKRGISFDIDKLSGYLKAPVVPTIGNRSKGMDALLDAVAATAAKPAARYSPITYPAEYIAMVDQVDGFLIGADRALADRYPPKWMAARLLESDSELTNRVDDRSVLLKIGELRAKFEKEREDSPEIRATEAKYGWVAGLVAESTRRRGMPSADASDKADAILLNRYLGLPLFLAMMYLMFQLVFTLAEPPMEWIENAFGGLGEHVAALWPKSADSPLRDLLVDGVIGGVGGVLVFLPNILLLFLAIAFLEGTGYMARAAFIMDGLMHRIGLHGKSFIPMLLGFGCTVPAVMGTRTLENRRDRFTTIMVLPFMSCGARLPIYALIIPAFFPGHVQAWMLWIMYVIGILFAIVGAKILRGSVFKGDTETFVMELPPYRMPTLRTVLLLMWERAKEYIKKAGTIILAASVILWAMAVYPTKKEFDRDYEAETEAAETGFMKTVRGIGDSTGLGADGELLASWTGAKQKLAAAGEEYWESEPGFATAESEYEATAEALYARPGGDKLKEFADTLAAFEEIDAEFGEAAGEEEEDSPAYRNAMTAKEAALRDLEADPNAVAAVEEYREAEGGLAGAREEAANAKGAEQLAYSISGRVGRFLEPVLRPLGFDWRIGTAIIGSFAAKEVFVAQMGIVYSVGEADEESDSLRRKLQDKYTPLQGFCMMLYALLSLPCVATIAVVKRETGGWKWALIMAVTLTLIAYVTTMIVFQAGSALGIGI